MTMARLADDAGSSPVLPGCGVASNDDGNDDLTRHEGSAGQFPLPQPRGGWRR